MKDNDIGFFIGNDDENYIGDERIRPYVSYKKEKSYCIYCSDIADSREHLPPRIFVDNPNLNEWCIVPACNKCNNGYSTDEQFVACAIEYILAEINYGGSIQRNKIKKTFEKRPHILEKIKSLCIFENGSLKIDNSVIEKIKMVVLKIARGHLMYDCNEFLNDEDVQFLMAFKPQLEQKKLEKFNMTIVCNCLPEFGSRMSNQLYINNNNEIVIPWKIIDNDNYRYLISPDGIIRIVIREFLYIEIIGF